MNVTAGSGEGTPPYADACAGPPTTARAKRDMMVRLSVQRLERLEWDRSYATGIKVTPEITVDTVVTARHHHKTRAERT